MVGSKIFLKINIHSQDIQSELGGTAVTVTVLVKAKRIRGEIVFACDIQNLS